MDIRLLLFFVIVFLILMFIGCWDIDRHIARALRANPAQSPQGRSE